MVLTTLSCVPLVLLLWRAPSPLPLPACDVDVVRPDSATFCSSAALKLLCRHGTVRGIHTLNPNMNTQETNYLLYNF